MFSDTSIIRNVNILNKTICYLLVLIMLIICKETLFTLFVDIFFLLVTKQYKHLFRFNILTTILIVLNIFFPHFLWIIKIFLLIIYTILLSKVTELVELRYVLENTLYRFKNKKITYRLFYIIYFIKNFKKHFTRMLVLKDDYEIKMTPKFLLFIIKQSYIAASTSKKDFLEVNDIRFYNISKDRTYIEKLSWESWDTTYLLCHIIILVSTFFYGR